MQLRVIVNGGESIRPVARGPALRVETNPLPRYPARGRPPASGPGPKASPSVVHPAWSGASKSAKTSPGSPAPVVRKACCTGSIRNRDPSKSPTKNWALFGPIPQTRTHFGFDPSPSSGNRRRLGTSHNWSRAPIGPNSLRNVHDLRSPDP